MPTNFGYPARPRPAGRTAIAVLYVCGVPAMFLLLFLTVAVKQAGGPGPILAQPALATLAVIAPLLAAAALTSLVVAIIQAYSADQAPAAAAGSQVAPGVDPWATAEVAPTAVDELAGAVA